MADFYWKVRLLGPKRPREFFFIYAISMGSGLAYKQNYFVFLDIISKRLTDDQNRKLEIGSTLIVLILFAILTIFSIQYIQLGSSEKSPSLGINMSVAFFSIFIMGFSIIYFAFIKLRNLIRNP